MIKVDLADPVEERLWRRQGVGCLYEVARRFPGTQVALEAGKRALIIVQDGPIADKLLSADGLAPIDFASPDFLLSAQQTTRRQGPPLVRVAKPVAVVRATTKHVAPLVSALGSVQQPQMIDIWQVMMPTIQRLVGELSYPPGVAPSASDGPFVTSAAAKLATAVCWGAFLLAVMPDLQTHLREKIAAVDPVNGPTLAQMDESLDLMAFLRETLRIFPPVPVLGREATADVSIHGLDLTAGQRVAISIIGMHHDTRYFISPAELRLDRFSRPLPPAARFMPFGFQGRGCAAPSQSEWILGTCYVLLLRSVQLSIIDQDPFEFEWSGVLGRRGGHHLFVQGLRT